MAQAEHGSIGPAIVSWTVPFPGSRREEKTGGEGETGKSTGGEEETGTF